VIYRLPADSLPEEAKVKYKLIIFDIDGTIARHISSWRYIHEELGLWDALAFKYQSQFLAGRISYRKFCQLDAAHWKGLEERRIINLFKKAPYARNAVRYIKQLKKLGFKLAAVSTGLQYMAERIKEELDFDYVIYNKLLSRKGLLTGGVKINITHGAKGKVFKRIVKRFRLKPHTVISVGDSEGDVPLVRSAGYSIAFNSSSRKLSRLVDYECRTKDFREVFKEILRVNSA